MKPYSVEIFDRQLEFVCNTLVDEFKFKSDYMDPEKYTLELTNITTKKGYFIHIIRDTEDYIGIISAYEEKHEGVTNVTVTELPYIFDVDIMIDVNDMGGSMENYIKKQLKALFVDGDTSMKMPFNISVGSNTPEWNIEFDIENEPDEDEPAPPITVAFINLFDDLILPAFTSHQIKLDYSIDLLNKNINIDITKNTEPVLVIEADLPNIIEKSVIIRKNKKQTNKVIVYNEEDYRNKITYYLYSDDTFGTIDKDRQFPVEYKLLKAKKETEKDDSGTEVVVKTFDEVAYEEASETFGKNKYTNLIELDLLIDDELIKPTSLTVGQVVSVISDGTAYNSILTGREINKTMKLIFGTVRLELSKYLKGRA